MREMETEVAVAGTHDHSPAVHLEILDEGPPPDPDPEASWPSSFTWNGADIAAVLDEFYIAAADTLYLPQGGPHEIRVTVRGREASFAHGVEQWRIQIWPRRLAGPPENPLSARGKLATVGSVRLRNRPASLPTR